MCRRTDLDFRLTTALRKGGLTNEMIRSIVNAPDNLKVPHHIVTDMAVHIARLESLKPAAE